MEKEDVRKNPVTAGNIAPAPYIALPSTLRARDPVLGTVFLAQMVVAEINTNCIGLLTMTLN